MSSWSLSTFLEPDCAGCEGGQKKRPWRAEGSDASRSDALDRLVGRVGEERGWRVDQTKMGGTGSASETASGRKRDSREQGVSNGEGEGGGDGWSGATRRPSSNSSHAPC
jgi:hypothetical protein